MKRSLVLEINLAIVATLLVVAVIFSIGFFPHQKEDRERFIKDRLFFLKIFKETEERTLMDPIFEKQWETLNLQLQRLTETDKIEAVVVFDKEGKVLAAFPEKSFTEDLDEPTLENLKKKPSGVSRELDWNGIPTLFYEAPLLAIGDTIGFIRFTSSLQEIMEAEKRSQIFFLSLLVGLIVASTLLLNGLMSRFVTKPVQHLVKTVEELEKGNWDARSKPSRQDEIGRLQLSFNSMIERLQSSFHEIEMQNLELKELDSLKNEFLANVSHEIRTPLNAIIGFTEGMYEETDENKDPDQKKYLRMVFDSARHLNKLVNQLLDFSQIKSGKMRLLKESFSPHKVVESILPMVKKILGNKPVRLTNQISENFPMAKGDITRVQQIFLNLLENASKFTEKGDIFISAQEEGPFLRFSVTDTGIGVSEGKQEIIFEEFRQADGSTRRKYGGTGLGLAIVRQLVTFHGGKVWVESTEGKGSSFHFTLPKA